MIFVFLIETLFMKVLLIAILTIAWVNGYSQQRTQTGKNTDRKVTKPTTSNPANNKPTKEDMAQRQTITDRYLNGPVRSDTSTNNRSQKTW